MSDDYESLFHDAIEILNDYKSDYSPEFQCEEYYNKKNKIQNKTVREIIVGCIANKNALDVLITGFYKKDGKLILRSEENIYKISAYIILYCFEQFGVQLIKNFLKCVDSQKLYRFLNFLTHEKNIDEYLRNEWLSFYDSSYVESKLIAPLKNALPELIVYLKQLKKSIEGNRKSQINKTTRPKSFNLSELPPKKILIPLEVSEIVKSKLIPSSTYEPPKEFQELKQISLENKKNIDKLLMNSKFNQPRCASLPQTSKKNSDEDGSEKAIRFQAKPAPQVNVNSIPVKLNAATILKQGHLYKKETDEVFQQLEDLENGETDLREYIKWQEDMKKSDLEQSLLKVERLKLLGKLSYEEAIMAKEKLYEERKINAMQLKNEKNVLKEKVENAKMDERKKTKETVERICKDRLKNKAIQNDLQQQKQNTVRAINELSDELFKKAIKKAEEEMQQKMELIQQIKAIESIPVIKESFIDLTDTAGHSLLSEMSIAELRERILLLQQNKIRETEKKHDEIISSKLKKDKNLVNTLEFINTYKNFKNDKFKLPKETEKNVLSDNQELVDLNKKILSLKKTRIDHLNNKKTISEHNENANKQLHMNYISQRRMFETARMKDIEASQENVIKRSYKL